MRPVLFLLLCILSICSIQSQETFNFPEDAIGKYSGTLLIDSPRGKQEIPMEFHFMKTDSIHKFDYKLVYAGQPRNYTLVIKDKEKGICEVDENNGILLPSRFSGNTLFSFFEVQNNFLSSRFEFRGDSLVFEILFSNTKSKTTSGGTSEQIPEIYGYPISTIQKAILTKVKE